MPVRHLPAPKHFTATATATLLCALLWGCSDDYRGTSTTAVQTDEAVAGTKLTAVDLANASASAAAHAKDVGAPPGTPFAQAGIWWTLAPWPLIPLHMAMTTDGRLLTYGTNGDGVQTGKFIYDIWDPGAGSPAAGHLTLPNGTGTDLFCSAQINLPYSNKMFIQGGDVYANGATTNRGNPDTQIFDTVTNTLTPGPKMFRPRWYGTNIVMPNGEIYLQGGLDGADLAEVRQVDGTFRALTGMPTGGFYWFYPRNFVAPDGRVFGYDSYGAAYWADVNGAGNINWTRDISPNLVGDDATVAMFAPGKVLQVGANTNQTAVIDFNAPVVSVTPSSPTSTPRRWANATILADGKVLVTGGSEVKNELVNVNNSAEIWDPVTGTWSIGATGAVARLYHSAAILLPDGSVLVGGGGAPGPLVNTNAELYRPPYLFTNNWFDAPRPSLTSAPYVANPGDTIQLGVGAADTIARVTFVKTGSVTHSYNMEQRFHELKFTRAGNVLNAELPPSGADLTPGYWLAFVINAAGTPSVGKLVRIDPTTAQTAAPWTAQIGGNGGGPFRLDCPSGNVLAGVSGYADALGVNRLVPLCVKAAANGTWQGTPAAIGQTGGPWGAAYTRQCATNSAVSSFQGKTGGGVLSQLVLECKNLIGTDKVAGTPVQLAAVGAATGATFTSTACPDATRAAVGLYGKSGESIDAMGLTCGRGLYAR